MPDLGVSTTIINTMENSSRNFGLSWTLDLCEARLSNTIPWKDRRQETTLLLLIKFSWNNWQETNSTNLLDNDLDFYYYFLKGTRLDLELYNSCWIQSVPNFATKNINIWFLKHQT